MTKQLVSIVLPVLNQADYIQYVVKEYEEALSKIDNPHELILVTNGCKDNSVEICEQLTKEYKFVKLENTEKCGWGLSVKLGLNKAKGDILCYISSSRTSPQELISLLRYAFANPDVVVKAQRKFRGRSWVRLIGSLLYNVECRSLIDIDYWDVNGTPKVFPRKLDKLLNLKRNDDLIDAEFSIVCKKAGYRILSVPLFSSKWYGSVSRANFASGLKMYFGLYKMCKTMSED